MDSQTQLLTSSNRLAFIRPGPSVVYINHPPVSARGGGAISLFLVKTPHRDFSHAHMSALPGDVTSLATECNATECNYALRSLDSTHLASAPFASTLSSITLVVYSINMTLALVAARNQLNGMRVILNNVTGSPSPTVIQCANTVTGFFFNNHNGIAVICVTKSRTGNYDFRACARARGFPGSTVFGRTHTLRRACRAITR